MSSFSTRLGRGTFMGLLSVLASASVFVCYSHANEETGDRLGSSLPLLSLRREIPYDYPLQVPQDLPWHFERFFALHPDGTRALVLLPERVDAALQRRLEKREPMRRFRLAWVHLGTGEQVQGTQLKFGAMEHFGFSVSAKMDFLCAISDDQVRILNSSLHEVASLDAHRLHPGGEQVSAVGCHFFRTGTVVLILFQGASPPWDNAPCIVIQWDFNAGSILDTFMPPAFIDDALPLSDGTVVTFGLEPGWAFRFRGDLRDPRHQWKPQWTVSIKDNPYTRLTVTNHLVVRSERQFSRPQDTRRTFAVNTADSNQRLDGLLVRNETGQGVGPITLQLTGKILMWRLGGRQRPVEFSVRRMQLQWPTVLSIDERRLATRMVRFTHVDRSLQPRWNDSRFAIFDIDKPKKPVYVSDNFGPEEAVTALAFSRDGKTLVVATSRRLLIYDVKESAAK